LKEKEKQIMETNNNIRLDQFLPCVLPTEKIGYVFCSTIYPGKAGFIWYFKGVYPKEPESVILFGTGSTAEDIHTARMDCFKQQVEPLEGLWRAGISPEMVKGIIVDHAHWDHVGALDQFPNAQIYIHRLELAESFSPRMDAYMDFAADRLYVCRKRLRVIEDKKPYRISDNMVLLWTGGHSPGHIVALVNTDKGLVLFGGDIIMTRENITRPFLEFYHDWEEVIAFQQRLANLGADIIISGHDEKELELHPNGKF